MRCMLSSGHSWTVICINSITLPIPLSQFDIRHDKFASQCQARAWDETERARELAVSQLAVCCPFYTLLLIHSATCLKRWCLFTAILIRSWLISLDWYRLIDIYWMTSLLIDIAVLIDIAILTDIALLIEWLTSLLISKLEFDVAIVIDIALGSWLISQDNSSAHLKI